jgi:hypothetical protein
LSWFIKCAHATTININPCNEESETSQHTEHQRKAERRRDEHWQGVVAEKDAALASKDARIAELEERCEG